MAAAEDGPSKVSITSNGGSRPVPDPTALTDKAIEKAMAAMRDYIDGQLAIRDERLNGIDKATGLRLDVIHGVPGIIDEKVAHLAEVVDVRFGGIETQFRERDARALRETELNKIALDAAFSASKEAVAAAFAAQKEDANRRDEANGKAIDKSERATAETIKTNQELGATQLAGLAKGLDETKERVTRQEANKQGGQESKAGLYSGLAALGGVIGLIVLVIGFIASRGAP